MSLPSLTQKPPPIPLDELVPMLLKFPSDSLPVQHQTIDRLVFHHGFLSFECGEGWRYKRARRIGATKEVTSYTELIWPPELLATPARAGSSVLYLADRLETALSEIHVDCDEILLSTFRIKPGKRLRLLPIGEYSHINRSGRGRLLNGEGSAALDALINACDHEEALAYLITDSFLHECLTSDKTPYLLSSYICGRIFNKEPLVSGIAYPSVQRDGSINFAVKKEGFWDTWGIESASRYQANHLAQGYFRNTCRRNVKSISSEGNLAWGQVESDSRKTDAFCELWSPPSY